MATKTRDQNERSQPVDSYGERLRAIGPHLAPTARLVVDFIDRNRIAAIAGSAADLAKRLGTSDATVVRAVQALGFRGLDDMRQVLANHLEGRATPADDMRRTLDEVGSSVDEAVQLVLRSHSVSLDELRSPQAVSKITKAVVALERADRIFVFGMGPSGALARYAELILRRDGREARALDASGTALADQLLALREGDALLALAYGRAYREVAAAFAQAKRLGLPVVLLTDSLDQRLRKRADVVVPVKRGMADRSALHGTTFVALEAIMLGLAACDRDKALGALDRLNDLRELVLGARADIG